MKQMNDDDELVPISRRTIRIAIRALVDPPKVGEFWDGESYTRAVNELRSSRLKRHLPDQVPPTESPS